MSRLTSLLREDTRMLLLVIPVSHEEHISREGYDHWSSSLLARFTYKVSVVPLLNMFRFGPWLSGTLFHTTHHQVLRIHRRDKNVSTTHISLYQYENVSEIRTFSLEYFLANHREKRLATPIFSVRFYCSACGFGCYALQFHVWLSTSWRHMKPEDVSNHGVVTGIP